MYAGINNKGMETTIITSREFRQNQKKYFDLAEKQRVIIKRGKKQITLMVRDDEDDVEEHSEEWVKEFFAIPEEYRCNPYDYCSDGDLFYADKRNVEKIKEARQEAKEGKTTTRISSKEELYNFLEGL